MNLQKLCQSAGLECHAKHWLTKQTQRWALPEFEGGGLGGWGFCKEGNTKARNNPWRLSEQGAAASLHQTTDLWAYERSRCLVTLPLSSAVPSLFHVTAGKRNFSIFWRAHWLGPNEPTPLFAGKICKSKLVFRLCPFSFHPPHQCRIGPNASASIVIRFGW